MSETNRYIAVCFADICGSTRLYETLGDSEAQRIITRILHTLCLEVESLGGRVVKTLGDAVMSAYPHARPGLEAARAMQRRVTVMTSPGGDLPPLQIHSGLHWGEVLDRDGDLFGDAVNVAAKLAAMAKPGQILTTSGTLKALGTCPDFSTRFVTRLGLGGKAERTEIHEVLWDEGNTTFVHKIHDSKVKPRLERLVLTLSGTVLEMEAGRHLATLGRGPMNDLVVPGTWVSRNHAQILRRAGKFILKDQSTNGTYLIPDQGEPAFLKLDEAPLTGSGEIKLGRPDAPPEESIHYEFREC